MEILSTVISLFGCSKAIQKPKEVLTSISMVQSHMNRAYCYSFSIYRNNSDYIFSAWCMVEKGTEIYDIDIENVEIKEEEFDFFKELDKEYNFISNQKEKSKKEKYFVSDQTTNSFKVGYGSDEFDLKTEDECYHKAYDYFAELAIKYSNGG